MFVASSRWRWKSDWQFAVPRMFYLLTTGVPTVSASASFSHFLSHLRLMKIGSQFPINVMNEWCRGRARIIRPTLSVWVVLLRLLLCFHQTGSRAGASRGRTRSLSVARPVRLPLQSALLTCPEAYSHTPVCVCVCLSLFVL